jgi:hypothetical protein
LEALKEEESAQLKQKEPENNTNTKAINYQLKDQLEMKMK